MSKTPNPFEEHAGILCQDYGAAQDLRALVLNLFNNSIKVDMASVMRRDFRHTQAALDMLLWYAEHGENCPVFISAGRRIAEEGQ